MTTGRLIPGRVETEVECKALI